MKETLITFVTFMGFLCCMNFLMHKKICSLGEKCPAHGALVHHVSYLVTEGRKCPYNCDFQDSYFTSLLFCHLGIYLRHALLGKLTVSLSFSLPVFL